MKFRIVVVGRVPTGPLGDAIAEFERRAARYWPLDIIEVKSESSRSRDPSEVRRLEATRLLDRTAGLVVALDERGRTFTSESFAAWMQERRELAGDVSFVIGGATGLDDSVRDRAAVVLSVASWTLPHDLARLVLAEQVYRAGTLARNEPYHRA